MGYYTTSSGNTQPVIWNSDGTSIINSAFALPTGNTGGIDSVNFSSDGAQILGMYTQTTGYPSTVIWKSDGTILTQICINEASQYISRFNGPPGFSVRQPNNNNLTTDTMGMPLKPPTMEDGSIFSSNRQAYIRMKQQPYYNKNLETLIQRTTTAYYLGSRRFLISTSKATTSLANKYLDSSQRINIEKINAVGKSSVNLNSVQMSFAGNANANANDVRSALRRNRSSGYVVHKK